MAFDRRIDVSIVTTVGNMTPVVTDLGLLWAEQQDLFAASEAIALSLGGASETRLTEDRQYRIRYDSRIDAAFSGTFRDRETRVIVVAPLDPITGARRQGLTVTNVTDTGGRARYLLLDCQRVAQGAS